MRKIDRTDFCEAKSEEVVDHALVVDARLAHQSLGSRLIKECVMRERWKPGRNAMGTAKLIVTHQHMKAPIKVGCIVVLANLVFLCPVNIKVAEWRIVKLSDQRLRVFVGQERLKQPTMELRRPLHSPERVDALVVHPGVKGLLVSFGIQTTEAQLVA